MAKVLRAGVIGCGAISDRLHVPDYVHAPETELVALCDMNKAAAHDVAQRWAPEAQVYTDYKKMLAEANLDCVTITLPNKLHAPVTIDVLKAGCHALVEKPMATSMAECKKMCQAAKTAKKLLLVNQCQRLVPAHQKAKEVLDSGLLGKILYVTAMFGHEGPEEWSPSGKWFFDAKRARFGAMADLGVHKADLVRYLASKEIAEISGYTACLEKKGSVEDNFASSFKFSDGTLGTLGASWTVKGLGADYIMFHCAKGSLYLQVDPERPLLAGLHHPQGQINFEIPPSDKRYPDSWGLDVSGHFARACLKKEKPFCTGEEGMKSLQVILAGEKSALTGKSVKVASVK